MNPLVVAHICILHIIFLVLPPRLQGDSLPSSRVSDALMRVYRLPTATLDFEIHM